MQADEIITPDSITSVRPGYGISPKYLDKLIGKQLIIGVDKKTAVQWDYFN